MDLNTSYAVENMCLFINPNAVEMKVLIYFYYCIQYYVLLPASRFSFHAIGF